MSYCQDKVFILSKKHNTTAQFKSPKRERIFKKYMKQFV